MVLPDYVSYLENLIPFNIKNSYPNPSMDAYIDSLGEGKVITALEPNRGYFQIPVAEEYRDSTAFSCNSGLSCFRRIPFGLNDAPAAFQSARDILLSPFKCTPCLVYLDYVIIFSQTNRNTKFMYTQY